MPRSFRDALLACAEPVRRLRARKSARARAPRPGPDAWFAHLSGELWPNEEWVRVAVCNRPERDAYGSEALARAAITGRGQRAIRCRCGCGLWHIRLALPRRIPRPLP
ncbi:hypothetical protein ACFOWE_31260 [Planomonospora corallina]|uniref:Transposase n=1 Tax=Planomonospora corallina TaxID=1806052 RepID=A0ABV8IFJ1_9ACTN